MFIQFIRIVLINRRSLGFSLMDTKNIIIVLTSVLFLFNSCAPNKPEVSDSDIKRLIERMSANRFVQGLDQEEGAKIKSDYEIFLEACKVFRLDPAKVKAKLRDSNPKLYERLEQKNED